MSWNENDTFLSVVKKNDDTYWGVAWNGPFSAGDFLRPKTYFWKPRSLIKHSHKHLYLSWMLCGNQLFDYSSWAYKTAPETVYGSVFATPHYEVKCTYACKMIIAFRKVHVTKTLPSNWTINGALNRLSSR